MHPLKKRIAQLVTAAVLTTPVATSCDTTTENKNSSEDKIENVAQSADELLLNAAEIGDFEAVKNAIEKGANVNAQDSKTGRTALMLAYSDALLPHGDFEHPQSYSPKTINRFKITNYLINHKDIDLSVQDHTGANFLHHINAGLELHGSIKTIHPGELAIKEAVEKKMTEQEKTNANSQTAYYINYINQGRK